MRFLIFVVGIFLFLTSLVHAEGDVPADQLLSVLTNGTQASQHLFLTDNGKQPSVQINSIQSDEKAIFFEADMDIDCDGKPDDKCNQNTDPWFYPSTSAGGNIYASQTPFFVVPVSFKNYIQGVDLGTVAAVIYKDKVCYGPLLDKCAVADVIGEASYAMAEYLGIDPDPMEGGTSGPVTYIAFTGSSGELGDDDYTDHDLAVEIGNARARELVEYFIVTANESNKAAAKPVENLANVCKITLPEITITAEGNHTVTVTNFKGQLVMTRLGEGARKFSLPDLPSGVFIIKIVTPTASVSQRAIMY